MLHSFLDDEYIGPQDAPIAIETVFGWVLAGRTAPLNPCSNVLAHHATTLTGDNILRQFWETEEIHDSKPTYSPDEQFVVRHFEENHMILKNGRFIVPLPRKPDSKLLEESRSQADRRFLSLERSLYSKGTFSEFSDVIQTVSMQNWFQQQI